MRGSSTRICKRRRAPAPDDAPSAGMSGGQRRWVGVLGLGLLVARVIALRDQLDQLPRQGGLAGHRQFLLAALPVDGERVLVLIERQTVAYLVGCDHVQVLA